MRYSTYATPADASWASSATVTPPSEGAPTVIPVTGGVASTVTSRDDSPSVFPTRSTPQKARVWSPSEEITNGPVYRVAAPPSIRYHVSPSPLPTSSPDRENIVSGVTYSRV